MTADDASRSDVTPVPRATPLPWMLLGITLAVGVGMAVMGKSRIDDEKLRTANALKASDEVMTRLRTVVAENQRLTDDAKDATEKSVQADEKVKKLNEQLASSADELARLKSNPKCVGVKK